MFDSGFFDVIVIWILIWAWKSLINDAFFANYLSKLWTDLNQQHDHKITNENTHVWATTPSDELRGSIEGDKCRIFCR